MNPNYMKDVHGCVDSPLDESIDIYGNLPLSVGSNVLPEKFSLVTPPPRDQGYTSWCVSFSAASMQYCDNLVKYGKSYLLSPRYLHKFNKDKDGIPLAMGTLISTALDNLCDSNIGICEENLCPFTGSQDDIKNIFPIITQEMIESGKKNTQKTKARVTKDIIEIKKAIFNENGAIASFCIFDNFQGRNGFINPPPKDINKSPYVKHAVLFCGWDDTMINIEEDGLVHKGYFKIFDSSEVHTTSYGFRYLAYDFLNTSGFYSIHPLINEIWTTYDPDNLLYKDYHLKNFHGEVCPIEYKTTIKMRIGSPIAYVNSTKKDMGINPAINNGTTLVPLRFITEAFGNNPYYNNINKSIRIWDTRLKKNYVFFIGDTKVYNQEYDNQNKKVIYNLLAAPYIDSRSNMTLIPIRAVSELLGYKVEYNQNTKEIIIKG